MDRYNYCFTCGWFWVWFYHHRQAQLAHSQAQAQQQVVQAQKSQQDAATAAGIAASTSLQSCIDGVDNWYNQNINSQQYITQAETLLQSKSQQVSECQTRYPLPLGYKNDTLGFNSQSCLNAADDYYNKNIGNQKYITQANFLLEVKKELISECQIRWPQS